MPSERTRKKISRTDSPEVRFWANVRKTRGCWLWIGATRRRGYGKIRVHGPQVAAHRFSYEMAYGPIPSGHFVCHRCDNPRCVRPDHLFAGTRMENMHDMVRKGRGVNPVAVARRALTHCVHGHPFDEANTYHPPGRNVRKCRACAREQKRRQYQQARAAAARYRFMRDHVVDFGPKRGEDDTMFIHTDYGERWTAATIDEAVDEALRAAAGGEHA